MITPRGYFPIVNAEKEKENTLPVAGPVNSYKLSEEELKKVHEKYGKPGQLAPEPKKPDIAQPEPATVQFKKKTLVEQKMEEVSREEFAKMLETMTIKEIAKKLEVSPGTVVRIRNRYELQQPDWRTRLGQTKPEAKKTEPSYFKFDAGKPRLSLVPPSLIEAVGTVRTFGLIKHQNGPEDWRQEPVENYVDAMMRHMVEFLKNRDAVDPESGYPHLWHVACNIAFLIELQQGKLSG